MTHSAEMERQRVTCTSDDHVIEHWESHRGYVHVDGVRVLGAHGSNGVPTVTHIELVCSACAARHGDGNYTVPALLWGRYEHALGRPMFYFSAACPCPRHACEHMETRNMATLEQMETIEAAAYNEVARVMAREGVDLSYEQADQIGDIGTAWLRDRLGLSIVETDKCVRCTAMVEVAP